MYCRSVLKIFEFLFRFTLGIERMLVFLFKRILIPTQSRKWYVEMFELFEKLSSLIIAYKKLAPFRMEYK